MAHTPLPWTKEEPAARGAWIMGADQGWSALSCGTTDEVAAANAEFILRACNSHYDLLEALKAMVLNDTRTYRDCHKAALAAIAKAEGRSV